MACPFAGSVFAATITRSARRPLEMNTLEPLSSSGHPCSTGSCACRPGRTGGRLGHGHEDGLATDDPRQQAGLLLGATVFGDVGPHNAECSRDRVARTVDPASSSHMICS